MTSPDTVRLLLLESLGLKYYIAKRKRKAEVRKKDKKPVSRIYRCRKQYGEFHHLYQQLREDPELFYQYTRMMPTTFDYITNAIRREFTQTTTNFQVPISVEERLLVTLSYLATGSTFRHMAFTFRMGKSTVSRIVGEICQAIWNTLKTEHLAIPTSTLFENVASDFYKKWGFPNCIGSIDGKHIRIKCPSGSGSMYYNYKNFFSIVLLAVSDANYKFIIIDVGSYGKESDGGIFAHSSLHHLLESGGLDIPRDKTLPHSQISTPFVLVGDEAFPLRTYLMRPFPRNQLQQRDGKAVFNYRLSKARMVVECSFGIAASKWRILNKPIETDVKKAIHIVKATCILHNVLIDLEGVHETASNSVTSRGGRATGTPCPSRMHNRSSRMAIEVRNKFCQYFNS